MDQSGIFFQLYILPQLGKVFRFTAFILLETPFIVETVLLLPIALLLELACLWLANLTKIVVKFSLRYRFRIFLFWNTFFPLSRCFLFIKTTFVISTSRIACAHYPLYTIFHNVFHNLFQRLIFHYFQLKLSYNCLIHFIWLRICISHILTRNI